jgi:NAD(P)-dependent dehydrogenase (short-subunit alcohol dehydrogenase family)
MPAPVIIVTGVSRGIGRAIAEELQSRGAAFGAARNVADLLPHLEEGDIRLDGGNSGQPADSAALRPGPPDQGGSQAADDSHKRSGRQRHASRGCIARLKGEVLRATTA